MIPRRARRAMNQINVVPYIDVMLVLLVIFMVTAPFINPTQVELPSVGKSAAAPTAPLEVVVRADGTLLLRDRGNGEPGEAVPETGLEAAVRARMKVRPGQPMVISADKNVRYEAVMKVMDALQSLGVGRVGLLVKPAQP
ncbi:MAG TPA: protein TolR [Thiobacillaceae bacterium]|jgi:biopolymer transport protein TolR|nr:protein TolR [Thiobacillaceae bacterium]HNA82791.1 protein TolR [Thiobacillaceae bacterium]HNF89030.1 protein TolR [Thiobacillaceae bacterium]HNH90393.1 protein TolR [Thiobacillaceae bacterium]HNI08305.1 protein TolR [Thiobacillaceae bacterium]